MSSVDLMGIGRSRSLETSRASNSTSLDICFCLDATGSMTHRISQVKTSMVQLLNRADPNQVSRTVLLASLSNITKLILAHSLHPVLAAFIPALQRLRTVLP